MISGHSEQISVHHVQEIELNIQNKNVKHQSQRADGVEFQESFSALT
jgi:hypothetical protein